MACIDPAIADEFGAGLDEILLDDNALFLSIFDGDEEDDSRDRSTSDEDRSVSSSSFSLETLIPAAPQMGCLPTHVYPVAQAVHFPSGGAPVMMNLCSSVAMTGKRALNSVASGSASTDEDDEYAKRQRKELRLMKNREAANRSRIKKKHAMDALEVQVEQLNMQLSSLQQELAASKAECNALREQNDFLKTLVRTPGSDSGSFSATPATPAARNTAGVSSGVMVLAIVCAFTFVSDWFMFSASGVPSAPSNGSYAASGSVRGGRVLLSVDEDQVYGEQSVMMFHQMNWLARMLMYAGAVCIVYAVRNTVLGNSKHLLPF